MINIWGHYYLFLGAMFYWGVIINIWGHDYLQHVDNYDFDVDKFNDKDSDNANLEVER